jgi:hypothetical protein
MANYVFAYYGEPKFENPEQGAQYREKWQAWVANLGDALVDPAMPFGVPKKVSSGGVSDSSIMPRLSGFSVVNAESMDAAIDMAKRCPHLEHGTIDVAEALEM